MHLQHNKPSALLVANTKLANEWSANRCVPHISSDWLEELLADPAGLGQMNSMAKIRLLLAGLLALDKAPDVTAAAAASAGGGRQGASEQQQQQWAELQHSLQRLRDVLGAEADEWVKVMAAAAGPLDGRLHLDAVMQRSPAVQESMANLTQLVTSSTNQHLTAPLEDVFLRSPPSVLDPEAAHFVVRANPRVPPLSAGLSYAQVTPPPPSLMRAQGAQAGSTHAAAGAAAAAGAQRLGQSRLQQASSGGAARARPGLERQHSVVVLEDQDQAADLFKNTHLKHGVASAVRYDNTAQARHEQQQQQRAVQREQQAQLRRQQQQYARAQQEQEQRPKGRRFNIYGNRPPGASPSSAAAGADPPPEAAAAAAGAPAQDTRARQRRVEAEIDDLFDDDGFIDDSEVPHIVAPEGGSRVVRHLTHKVRSSRRGPSEEPEGTPDDLLDDMDDMEQENVQQDDDMDAEGDAEGAGGAEEQEGEGGVQEEGAEVVGGSGAEAGGAAAGGGHGVAEASAAKRRRMHVIASDSEDDD